MNSQARRFSRPTIKSSKPSYRFKRADLGWDRRSDRVDGACRHLLSSGLPPTKNRHQAWELHVSDNPRESRHHQAAPHRSSRPVSMALALTLMTAMSGVTVMATTQTAAAVTVSASTTPAFAGDAGDPDVVYSAGTYFAFTTGTPLGNHIQALVSSSASGGYHSYTGQSFGSTALATTPGWETTNTQTSPGVFDWGGHWLMYYDAAQSPNPSDTGHDCISVAVGCATLSPSSPQFTDTSGGGLICQPTGSIDPSPFFDPATGKAYLIWKQNDGGSASQATIWSQQLGASGLSLVGSPSELMYNNTASYPWENTVEDPSL